MKAATIVRDTAVVLACICTVSPRMAVAFQPAKGSPRQRSAIADVALQNPGRLRGKVIDAEGLPVATQVTLLQAGQPMAVTKSNTSGAFAVEGLSGGVYQIKTENGSEMYRLWTAQTSPPAAVRTLIIVDGPVIRGQQGSGLFGGGIRNFVSNPWVVGGVTATSIVIPLALDNDDAS